MMVGNQKHINMNTRLSKSVIHFQPETGSTQCSGFFMTLQDILSPVLVRKQEDESNPQISSNKMREHHSPILYVSKLKKRAPEPQPDPRLAYHHFDICLNQFFPNRKTKIDLFRFGVRPSVPIRGVNQKVGDGVISLLNWIGSTYHVIINSLFFHSFFCSLIVFCCKIFTTIHLVKSLWGIFYKKIQLTNLQIYTIYINNIYI